MGVPGSGLEKTWYWSCLSHPHPTRELKERDEEKETRSDQEQKVCKPKGMKKKRGNEGTETRVFWKVRVPSPHSHHTGLRAQALASLTSEPHQYREFLFCFVFKPHRNLRTHRLRSLISALQYHIRRRPVLWLSLAGRPHSPPAQLLPGTLADHIAP